MAADDAPVSATSEEELPRVSAPAMPPMPQLDRSELAAQWRKLGRAATVVALVTAPIAFAWFKSGQGWSVAWSLVATFFCVIAFRGLIELTVRRFIPWPALFGVDDPEASAEDVMNRRRAWFWRFWFKVAFVFLGIITIVYVVQVLIHGPSEITWVGTLNAIVSGLGHALSSRQLWIQVFFVFFLFLANIMLFMGPLLIMGISQIRGYEPGDADWGVKLDDVRGQAEAKEEVRHVVNLWQSGEAFEKAGGKRERGLLMLGAPGTGKTMLSKAIATGFNCPFVSIPGSGFAQTFIGIDAIIVRYLARKAKRLARKWGGQCIVFIDEIDAVGRRRQALGNTYSAYEPQSFEELCFFGPQGSLTPTGDLILETRAWRERLFLERQSPSVGIYPPFVHRVGNVVNQIFPGMFGGMGQLALNQLLVTMDGIGDPPFWRRFWTNRLNTFLDACFVIPQKVGQARLRLPRPRPRTEQIFFIGACNVPLEFLDPALTRPGRMGRHVWFRTPTRQDRLDIFNLYLGKVSHEEELDTPRRREELARITNGYSPAMIEQVCSMALTISHHAGRERFGWSDIVDAMTSIESGTAINVQYVEEETRAVAIHEAGHAVNAHVYMKGTESTRLSIRRRGRSLGHHQALEKEERFTSWQSEEMGRLTWTLGAMAAEHVFYGENSSGVGGDVQSATARAAWMVGSCAMAPPRIDLGKRFTSHDEEQAAREKIEKRFERLGLRIMQRAGGGGPFEADPIAGVLSDPTKRSLAAQMLGQAYVRAYQTVLVNKNATEHIAEVLAEHKELHGDEVLELLDKANLEVPELDLLDEATWPDL